MATTTQTSPSSFSRVRFGLGPKTPRSRVPPEPQENPNDADWYIPYHGPYELPSTVPRSHNRESWGQLLGSVLNNFGGAKSSDAVHEWSDGRITSPFPSSGAYSSHPYRMNAAPDPAPGPSTTVSQGRGSRGGHPRLNTVSLVPFANIDCTGGVGESPTPVQRSPLYTSPPASVSSRLSFSSFLTFGVSTRKSRSDSNSASRQPYGKRSRNDTPTHDPLQSNHPTGLDPRPSRSRSPGRLDPPTVHRPRRRSNTLITTFMTAARSSSRNSSPTSFHPNDSQSYTHPYAYTFPSTWTETSRRSPAVPPAAPHLSDKGKGVDRSYQYPPPPPPDTLNISDVPPHLKPASRTSLFKTISAPNLRNLSRGLATSKPSSTRGKYRWLSPETWCDAMLFPRPRFMVHTDDEPPQPFSHRYGPVIRLPESRTGGESSTLPTTRLLTSQSAVNLHAVNSESSTGPPRAEPMWIARDVSLDVDGPSSPGRSRSFAQDDLALPSPVPTLTRVLEMSASFERERAEWKATAARSLQSSKLTRSLGRSRTQSTGRTRAQLKDAGGMGFLATRTLLGNQLAAPTVHTPTSSDGSQTQHTRSGTSHARTMSSGEHSRAGSKSKAALRAATGLCISDDHMSPREELFARHDDDRKDARIKDSPPRLEIDLSPSPLVSNDSAIGIALSSPPPSAVQDAPESSRAIYIPDHPYAQSSQTPPQRSYTRSSSDYAGPHPSAALVATPAVAVASDMSARHRLPPHALHPYAMAYTNATSSPPTQARPPILLNGSHRTSTPPPKSSLQSLPQRSSPLSGTREASRAGPHAYASGSRSSGGPLVLADALSSALQRRFSADSGLGDSEGHHEAPSSTTQLLTSLPSWVNVAAPERPRPDLGHTVTFLPLHSNAVASSPAEMLDPPLFTASMLTYSSLSDEPLPGSHASSPQQSPPPLSRLEDLDRYRGIFYRPMGASRTPSDEHPRVPSRETGSLAGLDVNPTRQLGSEFEVRPDVRYLDGAGGPRDSPPRTWGLRRGGTRGADGMGSLTDPNVVLSVTSDLETSSPGATMLPLSMHRNLGRPSDASLTIHIPQDVESRTSSVLDRSEIEDADHDELLRVGTIEAVSTPAATTPAHHRFSFAGDIHRGRSQDSLPPPVPTAAVEDEEDLTLLPLIVVPTYNRATSHLSALPSATTEVTRSSYTTNTTNTTNDTGTSRISGLSDFPVPPTHTVVSSEILKSYLGDANSRSVPQADGPRTSQQSPLAGPSQLSPESHASEPSAP